MRRTACIPANGPRRPTCSSNASAAVLSVEDVQGEESVIDDMVSAVKILVVTEGYNGSRLYWNGDMRRFVAPKVPEVDPTGAGDIFATSFFTRLAATRDPWEAARFATLLAANSVTRPGLKGVPIEAEIQAAMMEILPKG